MTQQLDLIGSSLLLILCVINALITGHIQCRFGRKAFSILATTFVGLLCLRLADVPGGLFPLAGYGRTIWAGLVYASAVAAMVEISIAHILLHHRIGKHLEGFS